MAGFLGWIKGVPSQIWIGLGALAVVLGIISRERHMAKMEERRKGETEGLKAVNKVLGESSNAADEADAARAAAPVVSDASGVPLETQRRVFRD